MSTCSSVQDVIACGWAGRDFVACYFFELSPEHGVQFNFIGIRRQPQEVSRHGSYRKPRHRQINVVVVVVVILHCFSIVFCMKKVCDTNAINI